MIIKSIKTYANRMLSALNLCGTGRNMFGKRSILVKNHPDFVTFS